jgi:hypothetical protein
MDFKIHLGNRPAGDGGSKASAGEQQLLALRDLGISLRAGSGLRDVAPGAPKGAFDSPPYVYLLSAMGRLDKAGKPWSDDVWLWSGGEETAEELLANLANNFNRLTRTAIGLEDASLTSDEESGNPVLVVVRNGEQAGYALDPEGEIPPQLVSVFGNLATETGEGSRLAFTEIEDAGWLFVYRDEEQLTALAEATGLEWRWAE